MIQKKVTFSMYFLKEKNLTFCLIFLSGHDLISQQQKDIQSAQFHGQLAIEENIAWLVDEKKIIAETHNKLITLTKDLQEKIGDSKNQLQIQSNESKLNHKELIKDLIFLQEQTQEIFKKIGKLHTNLLQ